MTTNTYLIKEGYENLKKHGSKTFSTMLIICATMLVLGIFMILFTNVNKNVETVKVEQGIQAFIEDTATDADIEYIKDAIKKIDGVGEIRYISKDEAYEDAKNVFKDQEYFLEGLDKVQIFPASYVVKFADIEKADNIKSQIEKIDGIYKVKYNSSTINAVISISKIVNIFLLGIGVVLLVVSIFIISNTIKLAVYSNKREIFIMRYIGATNKFIKKPFVIEGAIMGIVSALISFMLISIAYVVIYARIPKVGSSLGVFGFIPYTSLWWMILAIYIVLGLFIGILGSSISIKKYLKA
ncbi:MAG: permease-like cell division protein FtsX [Christensenellales bacterium]|jgi:cell division transport system permease protein